MSESNVVLLLRLLCSGGNLSALLERGLSYPQITILFNEAIQSGFITKTGSEYTLSSLGRDKIRERPGSNQKRSDSGWVGHLEDVRIDRIGLQDVYVPTEEEVDFDA